MNASDVLVKTLEAAGVAYVFGIPGEENLDLLESLRRSTLRLIVTRHEQAAGFMAATVGRLTGRVGVCLATLGPGATNLMTAAAYAQLGAMPMLMITGQKPIKTSKQGHFQILDVVGMMRPLTKTTHQIVSGGNVAARVREAIRQAEEERPGAVHLELPEDIAAESAPDVILPVSHTRRPIAEPKAVAHAVALIRAARRPLLVIGAGANRKRTCKVLRAFVEQTGIHFVTTQMGKGVIDEDDPRFIGTAALSDGDFVHRALEAADLIINVGHDVVEKPPFFMRHDDRRTVIHVNFFSAAVDPVYFPQAEVVGDIANSIWQIGEALGGASWDHGFFGTVRQATAEHVAEGRDDPRFPMCPQRVVQEVRRAIPGKGIVTLDNGMYKIWFARNYAAHSPNTILLDNALATMGAGLPSAMAAALIYPERRVVAVCGDGGFMMNSQELETACRLKLDLTVVILRDDGYGMIKWKQAAMRLPDFGLDFDNPDFVKYAESYGATGHRVTAAAELATILQERCAPSGVHVVDVPVDYSHNDRILNHDLPACSRALPTPHGA